VTVEQSVWLNAELTNATEYHASYQIIDARLPEMHA